ncbi:MAG: hypothetical protein NTV63_05335 [Candidatus Woesearchaeota archaeon]|nr:hypothetical protein [Candidatus Woesearchaeota archaeon]
MRFSRKISAKKGDIAIQYVFLIFIATISVFVIVGMLTKWSFSSSKFMCRLTGECSSEEGSGDIVKINATDLDDFRHEVEKGAKLCYENGKIGRVKGSVCYIIMCYTLNPNQCSLDPSLKTNLETEGINVTISYSNSDKAVISYDYNTKFVKIE